MMSNDDNARYDPFVWTNPKRMSGEPCFRNTRVPVRVLFEYLRGGYSLAEFLDHFEGVPRESAMAVLALASEHVTSNARAA